MYTPAAFQQPDLNTALGYICQHPFGLLITSADNISAVSHLPFVAKREGDNLLLHAHLAGANPQANLRTGDRVLAVFQGPHGYVSPSLYTVQPSVPTWNYVAVHVTGIVTVLTGEQAETALLQQVETFEPDFRARWNTFTPKYREGMLRGICMFSLRSEKVECKEKLSQNRSAKDRENVIAHFMASGSQELTALAELMQEKMNHPPG